MERTKFVKAIEVEPIETVAGVWRRTLVFGDKLMLVHITLEEGAIVPVHKHPHEQAGYVMEGGMLLTVAGQSKTLKAGESYFLPSNVEHEARAVVRTTLIEAFSPPREDYIKP